MSSSKSKSKGKSKKPSQTPSLAIKVVDYAKSPSVGSVSIRKSANTPSRTAAQSQIDPNTLDSMETLLYQHLHSSISTLLRCTAVSDLHEMSSLVSSARHRATEIIETEIQQGLQSLTSQSNTSPSQKRVSAYAKLSHKVLKDLERALVDAEPRRNLLSLRESNQQLRNDFVASSQRLHEAVAAKEVRIQQLEGEQTILQAKNQTLLQSVELLERELFKSHCAIQQVHRANTQIHLQALDYKAEVDNSCARFLKSVEMRLGFVPRSVEVQLKHLHALKPPGDASYLDMRSQLESERRSRGSRSSRGSASRRSRPSSASPALGSSRLLAQTSPHSTLTPGALSATFRSSAAPDDTAVASTQHTAYDPLSASWLADQMKARADESSAGLLPYSYSHEQRGGDAVREAELVKSASSSRASGSSDSKSRSQSSNSSDDDEADTDDNDNGDDESASSDDDKQDSQ